MSQIPLAVFLKTLANAFSISSNLGLLEIQLMPPLKSVNHMTAMAKAFLRPQRWAPHL